ncbi:ATP-dependent helicase HrpB [Dongia sedimenti]|uniref:ATP-dependent helicase HrpB n=1 Tax=Dongia sedimenti TaxID=3064282 RepID=A0ABU0YPT8_9PROT|nr:ATP-dependent helicase HrpB [Rhodospirillaceae bacterium R-7]
MHKFPIDSSIPTILDALAARPNLVLSAPPGAGKTTRVPPALLSSSWAEAGRIVLLQPRRLAARAAAQRMAELMGEAVGETVGYRVRLDRRIGPKTRIESVTTGLFLRQLQGDPELNGVAAILFDEFHERSLDGDLALALALESQAGLRPDLRLLVMSATLDIAAIGALLPDSASVRSEGRSFPVETRHLGDPSGRMTERIEDRVVRAVLQAIDAEAGDALVFLPGLAEIRRAQAALEDRLPSAEVAILPLHGDLPPAEQDLALKPDPRGRRKIVLATSIAETSLTIDGIRLVIDSGEKRLPQFDPTTGMTRLTTGRVSLAAANQRRGRAGRTAPGICYRLWSEATERAFAPYDPPEILSADLAPFALELGAWGSTDPAQLALLDPPPAAPLAQARDLLHRLGALDTRHRATPHGKAMAEIGTHPRLAHMMLKSKDQGRGSLSCDLAALLSERDLVKGRRDDADLRHRLDLLHGEGGADRGARERIRRAAEAWRKQLGVALDRNPDRTAIGAVVALAYPDRLAQRRGGPGQYRLSNGKGARLAETDPLAREDFLAVAALDGDRREARIFLAAPLTLAEIEADFEAEIETVAAIAWNARSETVEAKSERRLWSLVLEERALATPSGDAVIAAMVAGIRAMGLGALPWTPEIEAFRQRIAFLRAVEGEAGGWPDLGDAALLENLEHWLAPFLTGITRRAHLARLDLRSALEALLDWKLKKRLDEAAPTHVAVPSGSRIAIDYSDPAAPVLAVRLQEMFGAVDTPRLAGGRVPVLLHLLSPARRPVQVTRDLASFWKNGYSAVRADLRGQYPKHFWPDDPLQAEPTARAKPRGSPAR